jgi:hypothetical protein
MSRISPYWEKMVITSPSVSLLSRFPTKMYAESASRDGYQLASNPIAFLLLTFVIVVPRCSSFNCQFELFLVDSIHFSDIAAVRKLQSADASIEIGQFRLTSCSFTITQLYVGGQLID